MIININKLETTWTKPVGIIFIIFYYFYNNYY